MAGLFGGDTEPVAVVLGRHVAKSIAGVEREVNRIEFDMRDRMGECGAAFTGGHASLLDLARINQTERPRKSRGDDRPDRRFDVDDDRPGVPCIGQAVGDDALVVRIRKRERLFARREQLQRRAWTNGHTSSGASITVSAPQCSGRSASPR